MVSAKKGRKDCFRWNEGELRMLVDFRWIAFHFEKNHSRKKPDMKSPACAENVIPGRKANSRILKQNCAFTLLAFLFSEKPDL